MKGQIYSPKLNHFKTFSTLWSLGVKHRTVCMNESKSKTTYIIVWISVFKMLLPMLRESPIEIRDFCFIIVQNYIEYNWPRHPQWSFCKFVIFKSIINQTVSGQLPGRNQLRVWCFRQLSQSGPKSWCWWQPQKLPGSVSIFNQFDPRQ